MHILILTIVANICDAQGNYLPRSTPPPPPEAKLPTDWTPFQSRVEFETADLLFRETEMSNRNTDTLFDLWAADVLHHKRQPPFADHDDLHEVLDSITAGDAPWHSFQVGYNGELPGTDVPNWMSGKYDVFYRDPRLVVENILANPEFDGHFDYAPYRQFADNKRRWSDFMSGNWCWKQAV